MSVAPSRAARSAGLLLAALSVAALPAAPAGASASSAPFTACPCNIGLPPATQTAAPATSSPPSRPDAPSPEAAGGFDYADAALGATAAAGTGLLVLGLAAGTRRHRQVARVR